MAKPDSSARILIVEDEAVVAADMQECLEELGYQTLDPVASGETALEIVEAEPPSLVMMDIRLQGNLDGIETAEKIRSGPRIPVIFVTAHADDDTLARAKITEPYGYVLKPFKKLELRAAVELALHRSGPQTSRNGRPTSARPAPSSLEPVDEEVLSALRRLEPFQACDEAELNLIAQQSRIKDVPAGSFLVCEGEESASGFAVLEGRVAMLKTSISGKELTVELLPPGDPFGLMLTVDTQPYPLSAKAQVDSRILFVHRERVLEVLDRHAELGRAFLENVFRRLRKSHDISRALAHDRVEVRIASALLALTPKFAVKAGEYREIPMTRQEIADLIGSTPETVIRVTKEMEREGILGLEQSGRVKLVDPGRLEEIANDF